MIVCIDTSVLVAAMVASEAFHEPCRALVAKGGALMYSHGVAETFSTLTGGRKAFRLSAATASELLEAHFIPRLSISSLSPADMLRALREAEARGVRGGGIFDYLHWVAARKVRAAKFYTLNVGNFRACYRGGDPEILHP